MLCCCPVGGYRVNLDIYNGPMDLLLYLIRREEIDIPAGTQTGELLKLSGRGMPSPRYRSRGDLVVQFFIEVPKKLGAEHERLLRELAEVENSHVSPQRTSFFKQLKEYFQSD